MKPVQESANNRHIAEQAGNCSAVNIGTEDPRQVPKNTAQGNVAEEDPQCPARLLARRQQSGPGHLQAASEGEGVISESPTGVRRELDNQARGAERFCKPREKE
jgi:hypothetical protein